METRYMQLVGEISQNQTILGLKSLTQTVEGKSIFRSKSDYFRIEITLPL